MSNKKKGCLIITVIVVLFCGINVGYFIYLDHWFNEMQEQLPIAKQKYLDNYHEMLERIPAPEGVQEDSRNEEGLFTSYQYGMSTTVYYTNSETVDIKEYYFELLTNQGWTIQGSEPLNAKYQFYKKDDACITIGGFNNNPYIYSFTIYQGYSSQDFSPDIPPLWYVQLRHFGEATFVMCE
jgi:hypothetical protein